jgi:hypothetical protein
MLPFTYTQAMMSGQGLGGVVVAVMNLLTLIYLNDPIKAAYIFFVVAVAVLVLCNIGFYILLNMPIVKVRIPTGLPCTHSPHPLHLRCYWLRNFKSVCAGRYSVSRESR